MTAFAKVRDFGCLADGCFAAAPSHAEMGIYDRQETAVLERYVLQVGLAKNFIVARCEAFQDVGLRKAGRSTPYIDDRVENAESLPSANHGLAGMSTSASRRFQDPGLSCRGAP
jgi:hypothetical protein